MPAKQLAIGVMLFAIVLASGCRAPDAPAMVAVTAMPADAAIGVATPSPGATDLAPPATSTPSVVPSAVASATPPLLPTPSLTSEPALLPTTTPTPTARALTIHEWDSAPVLFRYDQVCRDFCVGEVFSPLSTLILYADGRLIALSRWTQPLRAEIEQTQLSRQQVCALLNTFDAIGFLGYDTAAFEKAGDAFPLPVVSAELEVNTWAAAAVDLSRLPDFLPGAELGNKVALDRPLLMAYELIERLKLVPGEEAYAPQEMVIGLQPLVNIGPEDEKPSDARQWLPAVPWVADLQARARENEVIWPELAAVTTLTGSDATALLAKLGGQMRPRPFGDRLDGEMVIVYIRPLFPYESAAGISDPLTRSQIPGPDVAYENRRLRCTPEDGVVDFFDELVAVTDTRMSLFHPPPQPTVPQPYDRKESDQP